MLNAYETPNGVIEKYIRDECEGIANFLIDKNRKYGNSALRPVRIFSSADPIAQINVRIDDKLSRMMSAVDEDEDVVLDLIGYLILRRIVCTDQAERIKGVIDNAREEKENKKR